MLASQQKVINYLVENAKLNGNPPTDAINKEIKNVQNYNSMLENPRANPQHPNPNSRKAA